jgi:hypothetical protein
MEAHVPTISFPVFVCHTSDLDAWVDKLRRHSGGQNSQFRCDFWTDDREMTAGDVWKARVTQAIARAHGAVLLVGEHFMTSAALKETEWPLIDERRRLSGLPVVCVPIEGCDKEKLGELLRLKKLQDLIAGLPWEEPLPPTPEALSKAILDKTIKMIIHEIEQAVGVKSKELQKKLKKHSFDLERCLGIGPISSTYVAYDHHLGRKVFVKCLTKVENVTLFCDSIKQASQISTHPNIISTHSASLDRDPYYCVKEFVEGESLRRKLDGNVDHGLTIDLTQKILTSMCAAIHHFHALGKCGLNIKPSNIIIRYNDEVSFCPSSGDEEYCCSKDRQDSLGPDKVYVPPEQVSPVRHPDKSKADQYRLGVLAYEMLLGVKQFASQDAYHARLSAADPALRSSNSRVKWRPIETLRLDCPKYLSDPINRMIDIEPEERFPSVWNVIEQLTRKDLMVEIARESYKRIIKNGKAEEIRFFGDFYIRFV